MHNDNFVGSVARLITVDIDAYVGDLEAFTLDALKNGAIPVDLLDRIAEERSHPEGQIRRPTNSFIIFRSWFSRCLNINERDHKKISKSAGDVWKQVLTADQKQPFLDASARAAANIAPGNQPSFRTYFGGYCY